MNDNQLMSFNDGIIIGSSIGGNLSIIASIFYTKYMLKIKQRNVPFIEDSLKLVAE